MALGTKMMLANQALQEGTAAPPELGQIFARMQNLLDDELSTTEDASSSGAEPGRQGLSSTWRNAYGWGWHGYYSASSGGWQQGW